MVGEFRLAAMALESQACRRREEKEKRRSGHKKMRIKEDEKSKREENIFREKI